MAYNINIPPQISHGCVVGFVGYGCQLAR